MYAREMSERQEMSHCAKMLEDNWKQRAMSGLFQISSRQLADENAMALKGFAKLNLKKHETTMEVGGWVQVSLEKNNWKIVPK